MSAATIGNAIKALIESSGLGLAVYRDGKRDDYPKPFVSVIDGIARVPVGRSDGGSGESRREVIQVDLWQDWNWGGESAERADLAEALEELLHSSELPEAPMRVHGMQVISGRRLIEEDRNVVHDAITVEVMRAGR